MFARSDFATACCGLVHPLGVVGIDIGRYNRALESVSHFKRHNLLVYGIGVGSVAYTRRKECTAGVERSAVDVAGVEEHVAVAVDIVVGAALYSPADEVELLGFCVLCIVVEFIETPVAGVVDRTCKNEVESLVEHVVFSLSERAFLMGVSVVVAIDDIAHAKFLIFPHGVGSGSVVGSKYVLAA